MIINAFKNKIFSLYLEENMFEDKDEDDVKDENGLINYKKVERLNFSKRRDIIDELVKKHFQFKIWRHCCKKMKKVKDAEKSKIHADLVRSRLRY